MGREGEGMERELICESLCQWGASKGVLERALERSVFNESSFTKSV